jgi:ABC-type sugar transport system substrate-binding protein
MDDNTGETQGPSGVSRAGFLKRAGALGLTTSISASVLAACGGGGKDATAQQDTTKAATTAAGGSIAKKYQGKTIGIVHLTEADENEQGLAKALIEAADRAGLNWKFLQSDSQGDQAKAQQAAAAFVNQKVDAIIPLVVAARLVSAQLTSAQQAKIPVFGMWTFSELDPTITVDYTPLPVADAGALAGYMFSDLYTRKPKGPIKIALLDTDLDILQSRSVTVRSIAKLYPRAQLVDTANIDLTNINGSAGSIVQGFLSKHSDLDAIWTNYPPTGPGAAAAVEQRNKASQVGVYTHVAQSAGLKALEKSGGALRATSWVDLDWQSYNVVGLMLAAFAGQKVDRLTSYQNVTPVQVFTASNVSQAQGKGTAGHYGWTILDGTWKDGLVAGWKSSFAS